MGEVRSTERGVHATSEERAFPSGGGLPGGRSCPEFVFLHVLLRFTFVDPQRSPLRRGTRAKDGGSSASSVLQGQEFLVVRSSLSSRQGEHVQPQLAPH